MREDKTERQSLNDTKMKSTLGLVDHRQSMDGAERSIWHGRPKPMLSQVQEGIAPFGDSKKPDGRGSNPQRCTGINFQPSRDLATDIWWADTFALACE